MKIYVGVESYTDEIGHTRPRFVHWKDGRRFEIQTILDERRTVSGDLGGQSVRFICLINGKPRNLFFEGRRWFVNAVKN